MPPPDTIPAPATAAAPLPAAAGPPAAAHPWRGYALVAAGAAMFALNGNLARFLLDDGVSALHLSAIRSFGSCLALLLVLLAFRPALLRVARADLPALAWVGVVGLAAVHATYFLAIGRLEIGVAVTIQYLAPVLLLVWLGVVHRRRLAPTLWAAVALAFAGCFLVARAYDAGALDGFGLIAAFAAALSFCVYMVGSERAGRRHAPATTLLWSFGFASLFWLAAMPLTGFSLRAFDSLEHTGLTLAVVVVGTLLPFTVIVAGLRRVPASRAAVVATLEPVLAAALAWAIHDQALDALQVAGGLAVVGAVVWVQSHAPDLAAEAAPPARRR